MPAFLTTIFKAPPAPSANEADDVDEAEALETSAPAETGVVEAAPIAKPRRTRKPKAAVEAAPSADVDPATGEPNNDPVLSEELAAEAAALEAPAKPKRAPRRKKAASAEPEA